MGTLDVVVGGQFGSESKGHLTADLALRRLSEGKDVYAVRVAGHNAGHTAYDPAGRSWALRTVPAAMVVDPRVVGIIAAGSEVDPRVLESEIMALEEAGHLIRSRLYVDSSATLLEQHHIDREVEASMHEKSGSTAKGVGAARADRIMRTAKTLGDAEAMCQVIRDTGRLLRGLVAGSSSAVILEGTQGYGLGVHTEHYPLTTSSDCRAIDFLAMAGIDPTAADEYTVWLTVRPFPIRVAGPSGELKGETTFEALGQPDEFTTVTKKLRRVGEWDPDLVREAVEANGGDRVVKVGMSMLDKVFPDVAGDTNDLTEEAIAWLVSREAEIGAPIRWAGTSPSTCVWALEEREVIDESLLETLSAITDQLLGEGYSELDRWWMAEARRQADAVVPKAIEYSASDLESLGRFLLKEGTVETYSEAGVAFYAAGKVARIMGAIKEGKQPSEDSWLDLATYSYMALRVRAAGSWPGLGALEGVEN